MAENKVQFQKGLSVTAFLERFGTEERCADGAHFTVGVVCSRDITGG